MTSTRTGSSDHSPLLRPEFDRQMLRSAFVSLFWAAVMEKRRRGRFTLQDLANRLGVNKSVVSRWFSRDRPNWTLDKIADLAQALDLEIKIEAVERSTGTVLVPSGPKVGSEGTSRKPRAGRAAAEPR